MPPSFQPLQPLTLPFWHSMELKVSTIARITSLMLATTPLPTHLDQQASPREAFREPVNSAKTSPICSASRGIIRADRAQSSPQVSSRHSFTAQPISKQMLEDTRSSQEALSIATRVVFPALPDTISSHTPAHSTTQAKIMPPLMDSNR